MKNPTQEQIRKRAYEIYVRRGKVPGQGAIYWFQARQELEQMPEEEPANGNGGEKESPQQEEIESTLAAVGLGQGKEIQRNGPPLVNASAVDVPVPKEE